MENKMNIENEKGLIEDATLSSQFSTTSYHIYITNYQSSSKQEAKENLSLRKYSHRKPIKEHMWSYLEVHSAYDIIEFYTHGHTFNICDFDASPMYILDLDHLTTEQENQIYTKEWQEDIISHFELDDIVVMQSASRQPGKAKIFAIKEYFREFHKKDDEKTWDNIDYAAKSFRLEFEKYTSFETDPAMDQFSRITFPCTQSLDPIDLSKFNIIHDTCGQPKELSHTSYQKDLSTIIGIPVNMNEYNTIFGMEIRNLPRLEWHSMIWDAKKGKFRFAKIKLGKRHNTIPKLVYIVVFNALLCNQYFHTNFTLQDCDAKIKSLIFSNFENPNTFYNEEYSYITKTTYKIFTEFSIIDLFANYNSICKKLNEKPSNSYTPRSCSIKNLYKQNYSLFYNCTTMDQRIEIANKLALGDVSTAKTLIDYCHKDKSLPKVTRKSKSTIYQYILDKVKSLKEKVFYYTTKSIKELMFCYKHGIKYLKQIVNNNFLNVTSTYSTHTNYIVSGNNSEIDDLSAIDEYEFYNEIQTNNVFEYRIC